MPTRDPGQMRCGWRRLCSQAATEGDRLQAEKLGTDGTFPFSLEG